MYKLDYGEFYITNVCNLNCQNCNRFNNYAFSGHQRWKDHEEQYQKWSKIIDFGTIGILGGEPLLNPEFPIWLNNIATLWPNSSIKIISNGTQMDRWPDLYQQIKQYNGRVFLDISIHGFDLRGKILEDVLTWLQGPIDKKIEENTLRWSAWKKSYDSIRDVSWPDCDTPHDFDRLPLHIRTECINVHQFSRAQFEESSYDIVYTDRNGIKARVTMENHFNESSLIFHNNELHLQNSDPEKAISVCYGKTCHHFINGKLHKCGPVGLLPEFLKQFPIKVSKSDLDLINSYIPASADWNDEQLHLFIDDLVNEKSIPQCKFCPEKMEPVRFEAGYKKIKIVKKQK